MDRPTLVAALERGATPSFVFFWSPRPAEPPHEGAKIGPWVCSNWQPSPFVVDGVRYATNEHWMMAEKARLFGDEATLEAILATVDPRAARDLGRRVTPYDDARWSAVRRDAVYRGALAKFEQHAELATYLRSTGDAVLAEASPYDRVWGIGLEAHDPRAKDPRAWRGQNLLGFLLMDVRAQLAP